MPEYKDYDQIESSVLGLGHGASLREDVDGSGDQPILQGNETSLNCGTSVRDKKKWQKTKMCPEHLVLTWLLEALHGATRRDGHRGGQTQYYLTKALAIRQFTCILKKKSFSNGQ